MKSFLILALPRSRTAWLSEFLSYGDCYCGHDELQYMRQLEDVKSWFSQPNTGTVETAAAPFWRLALDLKPDLKIVTIRRDPFDAAQSAINSGLGSDFDQMFKLFKKLDHKLSQIEMRTNCKSVKYEDLLKESVCAELFEHLLPYKHDSVRWAELNKKNIQINIPALNRYVSAHSAQLERLRAIAEQKSLSLLRSKPYSDVSGLKIQFEPLSSLLSDGMNLMKDHCAIVGEHPDNFINKNFSLMQSYEDLGALQVTVARYNGKVFGYLVTILGESLESSGRRTGCHTAFFSSTDFPGLGLKLQRKALEGLKDKGVYEVVMRAGVRGSGDKVSSLYKRIGAEPFGTYYRIQLGES